MNAAALKAAQDVVRVRNTLDERRKLQDEDKIEPGVHWEVDAAIDYLADCLADAERDQADDAPKLPPFKPGDIVHFIDRVAAPPKSEGAKRVRLVRWVNAACQSGYLIDAEDVDRPSTFWAGYDSSYFEVRR